ncbi:MAG: flagellar basal body protein FliL [Hydrocarboniphaga sp.]|uniref:flagellar basal body-associated FliL family protein n=1 Tax=Hydrocarboniphaga sp. TaxID=2033016 RepID=UPI002639455C|nr:flagellar basal body-associated FliL family protein [Hydrocarboniphaga sp.]MDB5969838.1 flagellar basal body protein FliL [Hydrocarboniphaga sp.]
MARAATPDEAPAAAAPKKKSGLIPLLLCTVVGAAAAGGGVFFMTKPASHGGGEHSAAAEGGHEAPASAHGDEHGGEHEGGKPGAAQYLPIAPAIVVNLNDNVTMRYLSVDMELMSREGAGIEAAKLHMPRIRNTLMMLFTQQKYDDIVDREGKESLQKQSLAAVQAVLKEETGEPQVQGLFFTNFVMQ